MNTRRAGRLAVAAAALLFSTGIAWAVVSTTPVVPQAPKLGEAQVLNATSTISIASNAASASGTVTAYTCGTNGSKIVGMMAGTTDTSSNIVQVLVVNTSKVYLLATVTVAAGSGNVSGTAPVNLMSSTNMPGLPRDSDGNPFILCASGDTIVVGVQTTAVTSNKALTVVLVAADF